MLIHLNDRALLALKGKDTYDFLQSTITGDMADLKHKEAIYAAHLTSRGKFLYDFFVSKLDDMYVVDCNKNELMKIAQSLHQYVVSKDVEFHDLTEDYKLVNSTKTCTNAQISYTDPRHKNLGVRNWVKQLPENLEPFENYTKKRIELKIIDGAYDGLKEKSLINELGFEALNGVSFNKGCYVGQELTARTKFRTEPKKKVFKVQFEGQAPNGHIINCGNMEAGWLFTNIDGKGLAVIKTRYLEKELTLNGKKIEILG